ncbi:hypothetical protein J5N97_003959 [Dioscorea zingiberensis]|uniref:Nudix hydrolase domain-containing protein n=1 Tax=Dioscorea zingiberensis TaxID=325984 RepID=A0A9D5D5Q1_9LILI|nr:hypothetical protein J5N97_003959 [Dioscorea zingiberensis]
MACLRFPSALTPLPRIARRTRTSFSKPLVSNPRLSSSLVTSTPSFSWENVMRVAAEGSHEADDPRNLRGYFHKVRICNRGTESKSEFVPFVVEDQVVGYIHKGFTDHLKEFPSVFTCMMDNNGQYVDHGCVTLHASLSTPEERTRAIGGVIECLGELIPGIRNEHYPVTSAFGVPAFFSLERAAAPYFGIKAYGVHMNGYVELNEQKFLWIGKRSDMKPTYPGMLDHLVAGGLPHGISCKENLIKECEEEAGIPRSISDSALSVGAISYMDIDGFRYKRDVLFCYDLKLPADFIPNNEDGEVDSFRLVPVDHVANIIRRTEFFKPNCSIVIIDFLFRHGYISPDDPGYLKLLQSLRNGDCS